MSDLSDHARMRFCDTCAKAAVGSWPFQPGICESCWPSWAQKSWPFQGCTWHLPSTYIEGEPSSWPSRPGMAEWVFQIFQSVSPWPPRHTYTHTLRESHPSGPECPNGFRYSVCIYSIYSVYIVYLVYV